MKPASNGYVTLTDIPTLLPSPDESTLHHAPCHQPLKQSPRSSVLIEIPDPMGYANCVGQRNHGYITSRRSTRPQLPVRAHPRLPKLPEGCFTRPITSFSPIQSRRRLLLSRLLARLALLALPWLIQRACHLVCQRRVL